MSEKKEYILDNGWIVSKQPAEAPILHVTPLPNSIFRVRDDLELPNDIYRDIAEGERSIKELFKKHKLHNLIIKWGEPRKVLPKDNSPAKFYGRGFIVTQEDNKYFLDYQLARQGGGSRKFEISKEIYEEARTGKYATSDLFKKYNLYHLDIPENDVK
ncbi:MAG: hypothetical protein AAF600_08490 [Bacteroidota bacterium]